MPRRSPHALDALSFFIADVQTGFGPFIAVYLATAGWGEAAIGQTASIMTAEVLHSFGSAMLGPAVAAVSLAVVGRAALGERLGRNARFAAIGNGAAAAVLGAVGTYVSARAVFWLTAGFMLPGLLALSLVEPAAPARRAGDASGGVRTAARDALALLTDRRVLLFALCVALFHLGNAALLPLAGAEMAHQLGASSNLVIAGSVVVPQAIVAVISPSVGRLADRRGAALVLALGFVAVPLRAVLLAFVKAPLGIVAVQALDGIGAASFGVLVPLVAAALTRGTERFNLCLGVLGLATAAGATISTSLAGMVAEHAGARAAFLVLAGFGCAAVLAAWAFTPREPATAPGPSAT